LHTTTNILAIPELAAKCSVPFTPAVIDPVSGATIAPAQAQCCTSDITVAEFKMLQGKMDAFNPNATTVEEYLDATPSWRTDLYAGKGTLLTHAESIALFKKLGVKMTPELKAPSVPMPYDGDYTQEAYAQQMIDEYKAAGVAPHKVFPQSFNFDDVLYWIHHEPRFGKQAVALDGRDALPEFDINDPSTWTPGMAQLKAAGVNIIAPPMWMLLAEENGRIVPSVYARAAKAAGLDIITWTLERSGPLAGGTTDWYYQTVTDAIERDGDMLVVLDVLDVLAQDVGIRGIFSDWPATVTYYANCMDL
jgi:glycerophosphoryl diester phosphodiesterase